MIVFDLPKFVKHEKGKIFLKSRSIDFGSFCDYSKTEDLVRIEFNTGEREWFEIAPFFWNYPIREGRYVGLTVGNKVRPYIIDSIESKQIRKKNLMFASISPFGKERLIDLKKDYPFNKLDHEFDFDHNMELPF